MLAGVNGAGKSSIAGEAFRASGANYFNPDEAAAHILVANPGISQTQANSAAWHEGKRLLERAIAERLDFAFETTLGGTTIPALLAKAAVSGIEVRVWYAGLSSPELHIARVRSRVSKGGHRIAEGDIRRRYDSSRLNLIDLLPKLTELRVYDNSDEGDPTAGVLPNPKLVLHMANGKIITITNPTPDWGKPIVAAAIKLQ